MNTHGLIVCYQSLGRLTENGHPLGTMMHADHVDVSESLD